MKAKNIDYKTTGTCSQSIQLRIDEEGKIESCAFERGCNGNLQGICRLVQGQDAREVADTLRGVDCRNGTSCPDQLAQAILAHLDE